VVGAFVARRGGLGGAQRVLPGAIRLAGVHVVPGPLAVRLARLREDAMDREALVA
jgi:hypothetical protein